MLESCVSFKEIFGLWAVLLFICFVFLLDYKLLFVLVLGANTDISFPGTFRYYFRFRVFLFDKIREIFLVKIEILHIFTIF